MSVPRLCSRPRVTASTNDSGSGVAVAVPEGTPLVNVSVETI